SRAMSWSKRRPRTASARRRSDAPKGTLASNPGRSAAKLTATGSGNCRPSGVANPRERIEHLPNVRVMNMLLLLNNFEVAQLAQLLSISTPPWWVSIFDPACCFGAKKMTYCPAGTRNSATLDPTEFAQSLHKSGSPLAMACRRHIDLEPDKLSRDLGVA